MSNYAPILPRDKGGEPLQGFPSPKLALARYGDENASTSSVITLTEDTTLIELAAVTTPAVMRWVAASDTQASIISDVTTGNYDHVIPISTVRSFVVPIESNVGVNSVMGANRANGLYQRVAFKSIGVGSVLLTEF